MEKLFGTIFSKRVISVLKKHEDDDVSVNTTKKFLFDMLEPTNERGDMLYRYEHSVRVAENAKKKYKKQSGLSP